MVPEVASNVEYGSDETFTYSRQDRTFKLGSDAGATQTGNDFLSMTTGGQQET